MWKEIFHFRFYKCSTPLRNIATLIENWTIYVFQMGIQWNRPEMHSSKHKFKPYTSRPWNALLGHWPYNTIFLGQKCTLLVLRFLFIKKNFHYTIKHSLYINSKNYIFKKTQKKTGIWTRIKKKNLTNVYILI